MELIRKDFIFFPILRPFFMKTSRIIVVGIIMACLIGCDRRKPMESQELGLLFINEFMASNDSTICDEYDEYNEWVEIYYPGTDTLRLGGMYLTDDFSEPKKWQFPDTMLFFHGFLLIWADGEDGQGPMHTNFRLNRDGEQIGLFDTDEHGNALIDSVIFGLQTSDVSYGRLPDGSDHWEYFDSPTPGESNGGEGR